MIKTPEIPTEHPSVGEDSARFAPNLLALAILGQVRERKKTRRETDPSRTQELIREPRAGGFSG